MSRAAVAHGRSAGVDESDEYRRAERIWDELGDGVELFEHSGRFGAGEQECTCRCAQLAHHRCGGQAPADAVTDDNADAIVADWQHVVEVAADLQRRHRGFVADGETGGQRARRPHRALQRQRCLARGLELPDMLHGEAEMADQRGDELPVFGADDAGQAMLEAQHDVPRAGQHSDEASRRSRAGSRSHRRDGQRQPVSRVFEGAAPILVEVIPIRHRGFAGNVDRRGSPSPDGHITAISRWASSLDRH